MNTDRELIEHLMQLSKIQLSEQELTAARKDMNDILGYIGILSQADLSACDEDCGNAVELGMLRPDSAAPTESGGLTECSDNMSGRYYTVPKTVE